MSQYWNKYSQILSISLCLGISINLQAQEVTKSGTLNLQDQDAKTLQTDAKFVQISTEDSQRVNETAVLEKTIEDQKNTEESIIVQKTAVLEKTIEDQKNIVQEIVFQDDIEEDKKQECEPNLDISENFLPKGCDETEDEKSERLTFCERRVQNYFNSRKRDTSNEGELYEKLIHVCMEGGQHKVARTHQQLFFKNTDNNLSNNTPPTRNFQGSNINKKVTASAKFANDIKSNVSALNDQQQSTVIINNKKFSKVGKGKNF